MTNDAHKHTIYSTHIDYNLKKFNNLKKNPVD